MEIGSRREPQREPLPRPRRIIESLVKPPHANTLFLSSCPSSSLLFLLFVCSFSIGPYIPFSTRYHLRTLAATLSRTLHILPLPYQVLLDSPLLTLFGLLLNISALHERTRASTHNLIITRTDRIILVRP